MFTRTLLALVLSTWALLSPGVSEAAEKKEGDSCDDGQGICKGLSDCPHYAVEFSLINLDAVDWCDRPNGIVCCPRPRQPFAQRVGVGITSEPQTKAEQQCLEYSKFAPQTCPTPFITGGIAAEPKEFPSATLLGIKDSKDPNKPINWVCGGTLISKNFVLTAAHCTAPFGDDAINVARLGELDYSTEADRTEVQEIGLRIIYVHPKFELRKYNDIALAELERDAIFTPYVFPACLPPLKAEVDRFTAVGWGKTEHVEKSSKLLKVYLDRYADDKCAEYAENEFDLTEGLKERIQICARGASGNSDTCFGDSGGPLYTHHPTYTCMHIVAGVTAIGPQHCGKPNATSVNVKVNRYLDWIEQIVWKVPLSLRIPER